MSIKLLSKVKDKITGFRGTMTARCEYYTGCVLCEVIPDTLKDGIPQKEQWLDEQRLEEIKKPATKKRPSVNVINHVYRRHKGGPRTGPSKRSMPFEGE